MRALLLRLELQGCCRKHRSSEIWVKGSEGVSASTPESQTLSVLSQEPVKKRQWRLTSGRTRDKELTKLQLIVDSTRQKPAFLGVRVGQLVRVGVRPHALRLRVELVFLARI